MGQAPGFDQERIPRHGIGRPLEEHREDRHLDGREVHGGAVSVERALQQIHPAPLDLEAL